MAQNNSNSNSLQIPTAGIIGCDYCGGKLVEIRGRYPGTPEREVCPTCQERLEQIQEIANGRTAECQALPPDPEYKEGVRSSYGLPVSTVSISESKSGTPD